MDTAQEIYCAVCGGPFFNGIFLPPEGYRYPEEYDTHEQEKLRDAIAGRYDGDENYCDKSVLTEQSIAWLNNLRVIGKHDRNAFVTGNGFELMDTSGDVVVDRGDDTNAPTTDELVDQYHYGRLQLDGYYSDIMRLKHTAFPIHTKCFDVLAEVHRHRCESKGASLTSLDLDMLHEGMTRHIEPDARHSNLKGHAEFAQYTEQWWSGPSETLEPWYHDPLDIPVLNALDHTRQRRRVRVWARSVDSAANCLSDLPVELLVNVANHLDIHSVVNLARTCREVHAVLEKNFWRRRFLEDMPYLFEIRQGIAKDVSLNATVDWRDLYGRMMLQSYPGPWDRLWWKFTDPSCILPRNADQLLEIFAGYPRDGLLRRGNMISRFDTSLIGIASRRRVWKCAEELLDICEKHRDSADSDIESDHEEPESEE